MLRLHQVVAEIASSRAEVETWIEEQWVLPRQDDGDFLFDETDVARCHLIDELRRDLSVNDEAIPVILSLLDQLYAMRRALSSLDAAIRQAPAEAREAIARNLEGEHDG